jgi:hypothetical protein
MAATYTVEEARISDFLEGMGGGCSIFGVHPIVKEQKSSLRGPILKALRATRGPRAASWASLFFNILIVRVVFP